MFQFLPNLLVLNLNTMGLSELPDLSGNKGTLQELSVSGNALVNLNPIRLLGNPPDYSTAAAIRILNAENNNIRSVDGDLLNVMPNLKRLLLRGNELVSFPLESLVGAEDLEYLDLSVNRIEELEDWGITRRNIKVDLSGEEPLLSRKNCRSAFDVLDKGPGEITLTRGPEIPGVLAKGSAFGFGPKKAVLLVLYYKTFQNEGSPCSDEGSGTPGVGLSFETCLGVLTREIFALTAVRLFRKFAFHFQTIHWTVALCAGSPSLDSRTLIQGECVLILCATNQTP